MNVAPQLLYTQGTSSSCCVGPRRDKPRTTAGDRTTIPFVIELSTRADFVSVSVRCYLSEAAVLSLCTLSALRKCLTVWFFERESCTHLSGTACLLAQQGLFRKTHFICLENIHGCEARLTGPHTNNENSGLQGSSIHLKTYGSEI